MIGSPENHHLSGAAELKSGVRQRAVRVGSKVRYEQQRPARRGLIRSPLVIEGVVEQVKRGFTLMCVLTGKKTKAVRFMIRDGKGVLHETASMVPTPDTRKAAGETGKVRRAAKKPGRQTNG